MNVVGVGSNGQSFSPRFAWMAGAAGALVALGLGLPFSRRSLTPTWILWHGFIGLALLNIVAFSLNLLKSLAPLRSAKTDEEAERAAVPALTGEVTALGATTRFVLGALVSAMLGFMGVGFCLLLWRYLAR